jgi:2-keto-4-pentenoate hydratase
VAIRPLTEQSPDLTEADAYEVQRENIAARIRTGERAVGRKIGLTSQAMQRLIGVNEPDYGPIMDTVVNSEDQTLNRQRFLYPRVEGEIAFVPEKDLDGPGSTVPTMLKATAGVMARLKIVDSRIADWKIKLPDTVADNGSSARVVFGGPLVPVTQLDLRLWA